MASEYGSPITQADIDARIAQLRESDPRYATPGLETYRPMVVTSPESEIDIRVRAKGEAVPIVQQIVERLGSSAVTPYFEQEHVYGSYDRHSQPTPLYYDAIEQPADVRGEINEHTSSAELTPDYDNDEDYDNETPTQLTATNLNHRAPREAREVVVGHRSSRTIVALGLFAASAFGIAGAMNASANVEAASKACGIDVFLCPISEYIDSATFGIIDPNGDKK